MIMSLEICRLLSLRLFDENIYSDIIGDLKILDTIQPETNGNGCTVPTAMLILSSLDFIGFLLRDTGKIDDTEGNITTALEYKNYFTLYTPEVIKTLCIFYRHGIMHTFYPRQTSIKIYGLHKSRSAELLELKSINGYNITSLNVNILSNEFKSFVDSLYAEIKSTEDILFLENISKGFKIIYPEELTASSTTTAQTTIPYGVSSNK